MRLSKLALAVSGIGVIALSLFGGSAIAQEEKFINLGETSEGHFIYLDTEEIQDTSFKLYSLSENKMYEHSYYASCAESRLFYQGSAAYSKDSGRVIIKSKKSEELAFSVNSIAGKGMIYVCRRINARGW